jgi:hypothetical protein
MDLKERNDARKLKPLLRAIRVLWGRMGSLRIYAFAAGSGVIVLAAIGALHLYSLRKQPKKSFRFPTAANEVRPAQSDTLTTKGSATPLQKSGNRVGDAARGDQASLQARPVPALGDTVPHDPVIAIKETMPRKRKGRHGQTRVDVRIGVAPRLNARKGEVEIRVFFYDVTRNNEIRPTDARVAYEWLTPVRDWTDPATKYLAASYVSPSMPRHSAERLRYGGFIVQVYFDGQLQDEQSDPKSLLAALRSSGQPVPSSSAAVANPPIVAVAGATPSAGEVPAAKKEAAVNASTVAPITAVAPTEKLSRVNSTPALPYASPVPGKPGFVYSPYDKKFIIDVRNFPPGTEVNDPNMGKAFRVP